MAMDVQEFLNQCQVDMFADYARIKEMARARKEGKGPPPEVTELARQFAMGERPGKPGQAQRILDAWDKVKTEADDTIAILFASAGFIRKVLGYLSQEGYMHRHSYAPEATPEGQ